MEASTKYFRKIVELILQPSHHVKQKEILALAYLNVCSTRWESLWLWHIQQGVKRMFRQNWVNSTNELFLHPVNNTANARKMFERNEIKTTQPLYIHWCQPHQLVRTYLSISQSRTDINWRYWSFLLDRLFLGWLFFFFDLLPRTRSRFVWILWINFTIATIFAALGVTI